ncbi:MAG: sulfite exporter TauE/SafE family protein [Bacillota bacterium]
MYFILIIISLGASIIGALCGIGGGVIIKPALDMLHVLSVPTISFLSGCTVLAMSFCSVIKDRMTGNTDIDIKRSTPLAVGAIIGGLAGKWLFQSVSESFKHSERIGAIQSCLLAVTILGTLIYTLKKDAIRTRNITNLATIIFIGLILGMLSSFLGIGGGPFNLAVLYYFFSMDTKMAAQNSLYIIVFSQAASLILTLITGTVPQFEITMLVIMILCGIAGGYAGRKINKILNSKAVEKSFLGFMVVIIIINIYNILKFTN